MFALRTSSRPRPSARWRLASLAGRWRVGWPWFAVWLVVATVSIGGAAGCGPSQPPAPPPKVEAIFDMPREYRVLSALPCAEGAGLVYVLTDLGDLHSFQPDALEFQRIGRLECPAPPTATPNSMAVDRSGTAWLNYSDGSLYRASTRDASCEATGYEPRQHGFNRVGMAFASTGADLIEETLFVWGGDRYSMGWRRPRRGQPARGPRPGFGLGKIDVSSMQLAPIGDDRGRLSNLQAELTGTGDGRLFGFFTTRPATLAEVDVATGATRQARRLKRVHTGRAWAFSFWGGDFWFYSAAYGSTSDVTKLAAQDGSLHVVMEDIGFIIVGAGVSTCAPTVAPRAASLPARADSGL